MVMFARDEDNVSFEYLVIDCQRQYYQQIKAATYCLSKYFL